MDEYPIIFDIVGNKTVDMKGSKTAHIRVTNWSQKFSHSIVLSYLADGTKLKPMFF